MIQAVSRAFDILEYCAKHPEKENSLAEIAEYAGLHRATCSHIIKTMVHRKYLENVGYMRGYRLGNMVYHITKDTSVRNNLLFLSKPVMRDLCEMLNETVIVAVYDKQENKRIVLHTEYCNHELQVRSNKEKNAYDTSTGRLIMAYLPEEDQMNILENFDLPEPFIWKEASTSKSFERELAKIREKGIAIQVTASHVVGVAVPIFYKERIFASLGIYIPEIRYVGELKTMITDQLVYSAKKISERLNL